MFYACPLLFCVWQNYFCTTSKMLSMTINASAHIFWISEYLNHMTYKQLDIPAFPSSLAKRHLLLWLKLLSALSGSLISCLFLKLQKIKYSVKANSDNFIHKWQSLKMFLQLSPCLFTPFSFPLSFAWLYWFSFAPLRYTLI